MLRLAFSFRTGFLSRVCHVFFLFCFVLFLCLLCFLEKRETHNNMNELTIHLRSVYHHVFLTILKPEGYVTCPRRKNHSHGNTLATSKKMWVGVICAQQNIPSRSRSRVRICNLGKRTPQLYITLNDVADITRKQLKKICH